MWTGGKAESQVQPILGVETRISEKGWRNSDLKPIGKGSRIEALLGRHILTLNGSSDTKVELRD